MEDLHLVYESPESFFSLQTHLLCLRSWVIRLRNSPILIEFVNNLFFFMISCILQSQIEIRMRIHPLETFTIYRILALALMGNWYVEMANSSIIWLILYDYFQVIWMALKLRRSPFKIKIVLIQIIHLCWSLHILDLARHRNQISLILTRSHLILLSASLKVLRAARHADSISPIGAVHIIRLLVMFGLFNIHIWITINLIY